MIANTASHRITTSGRKKAIGLAKVQDETERDGRLRALSAMVWYVSVEAELEGLSIVAIFLKAANEELQDILNNQPRRFSPPT